MWSEPCLPWNNSLKILYCRFLPIEISTLCPHVPRYGLAFCKLCRKLYIFYRLSASITAFIMITIKFLEKLSEQKLLLSWSESARCNYTEQLWALRKARKSTTCVLSGEKILRGDFVYSPVGEALNQGTCIRADAVQMT